MKRRLQRALIRASALPTAMIFVVVVGIYAVTMPQMTGAVEVRAVLLERDQRLMTTALAALQAGKGLTYYTTVAQFRSYLTNPPTLPAQFATMNGYEVSLAFTDNEDDPDGNDNGAELTQDTDLVITMTATVIDRAPDLSINKRVIMAMDIRVLRLTEYNFASSNWGNPSGSSLASRHWYGNMLVANVNGGTATTDNGLGGTHTGYDYWRFSGRQYFHGNLHYTGFDGDQNNHDFTGPDANSFIYSRPDRPAEAGLNPLPKVPDQQDLDVELAAGGSIYDEADRQNLVIDASSAGVEIFLHPNGQIWTRPFNTDDSYWSPIMDGGTPITQNGKTIVIEGNATIRGVVTGRLTIAATDSMMINGNIDNPQYNTNHLGLVAKNAIFYENRRVYDTNKIRGVRPIDTNDWSIGGATGGSEQTVPAVNTTTTDFNFIAQPVFSATDWATIETAFGSGNNNPSQLNKFGGTVDTTDLGTGYQDMIGQYQVDDYVTGADSDAGRMPVDGALVFASMASGWYISPAVSYAHTSDLNRRIDSQGGSFEVRGTYSMGIGVDYMATWSSGGGSMTYQVHPSQQATAPDFFVPVIQAYPEIVYGSWRRLE